TAFRISLPVSGATLKISGKPATYVKTTAESGRPRVQAFCGNCGTPVYSTSPGEGVQPSYVLRVGILRQRDQLMPRRQIWWRSARPWVTQLGELPKQEKQG
ncbi:MAG: GFA family protein, partial [Xanthobacteraceae bacterium]